MKTKTIGLTLMLSLAAGAICFASPHMGTWKLNEAKSKLAPGADKNHTVVYAAAGDEMKVTVDGTNAQGKKTQQRMDGQIRRPTPRCVTMSKRAANWSLFSKNSRENYNLIGDLAWTNARLGNKATHSN